MFSILSFTASQEEISSRTTLQSFTRAAVDTIELDDVETDLLRSPQSFEDMLLRCGYRMMLFKNINTFHLFLISLHKVMISDAPFPLVS